MKTIRLLYPDYLSGGLDTYYFGAHLLAHILPKNHEQPLLKVELAPPDGVKRAVTDGIYAKSEVIDGIKSAMELIERAKPERIITIGGNCIVSQAPFDYLHGVYDRLGIIWIDAHPDISSAKNGYPHAHAMALGSLMGYGDESLSALIKNGFFKPDEILYIGLQPMHDYQAEFLNNLKVDYRIRSKDFITEGELKGFLERFDCILVHLDIDVLDANLFHSTYFANKSLTGDGSGGGKMTIEELGSILKFISENSKIVGFTIAEYLPFDEHRLHDMLSEIKLFSESV
ncbi:MAG: arginase family protein [Clostridia bacterium]|nr:arginase family protein [Clostridia bacterium]